MKKIHGYYSLKTIAFISITLACLASNNALFAAYDADMADAISQFNFRIDGAHVNDILGYYAVSTGDFDGNGKLDLLVGARQDSSDSNCDPGSLPPYSCNEAKGELYLIYDNLLEQFNSQNIGDDIDLNIDSNWSVKFLGENIGDGGARIIAGDINDDGLDDIVFNSYKADNNSRIDSGSTYIILNELIPMPADLISDPTQKIKDLNNDQNWNIGLMEHNQVLYQVWE